MTYDVDYFIEKFEAIPEKKWCVATLETKDGRRCALGFCNVKDYAHTCESVALTKILNAAFKSKEVADFEIVFDINDAELYGDQPTPKQRILAALRDIKKMQSKEQEVQASVASKDDSKPGAGYIKEFSPIKFEKIKELIPQLSNS